VIKPLPIGASSNLDGDATSAADGVAVAFYNLWFDRMNSIHTIPGLIEHDDTGEANSPVYNYFSKTFGTRVIVCNGKVWTQTAKDGALTEITDGTLSPNTPPCFCEDTASIFVAADSKIYKVSTTLVPLAGNSPDRVTSMIYHGGFILANGPEIAGDVTYSDDKVNGYALWEVYNNESKPDKLQTLVLVDNQWIYNIGPETLEVTFFGTNPDNPFGANPGRISSFGTIAKYSPCYDGQSLYYLTEIAQSRKIVQNVAGAVQTISFPIDVPIEQFERVDDAQGFIMAFRGQNFYCLHFPTANTEINEQYFPEITLSYHIQKRAWIILSRWDSEDAQWKAYRGCSFCYIEAWNLQLVGGRDGKTYRMYSDKTIEYEGESFLTHRWRDDNKKEWSNPRHVSLGKAGDYKRPPDQTQCGIYLNRQHEFSYTDFTDAGEMFRACIVSGQINHQIDVTKRSNFYRYNVKRGVKGTNANEFIINTISEDVDALRR
jgi:predicted DNA-binding protein (MmcQ/YjbR family)